MTPAGSAQSARTSGGTRWACRSSTEGSRGSGHATRTARGTSATGPSSRLHRVTPCALSVARSFEACDRDARARGRRRRGGTGPRHARQRRDRGCGHRYVVEVLDSSWKALGATISPHCGDNRGIHPRMRRSVAAPAQIREAPSILRVAVSVAVASRTDRGSAIRNQPSGTAIRRLAARQTQGWRAVGQGCAAHGAPSPRAGIR